MNGEEEELFFFLSSAIRPLEKLEEDGTGGVEGWERREGRGSGGREGRGGERK